jgi:hypothetical protein
LGSIGVGVGVGVVAVLLCLHQGSVGLGGQLGGSAALNYKCEEILGGRKRERERDGEG